MPYKIKVPSIVQLQRNGHLYHVYLSLRWHRASVGRPSGRRLIPPSEFHHVDSFKGTTTLSSFAATKGLEGTRVAGISLILDKYKTNEYLKLFCTIPEGGYFVATMLLISI